MIKRIFRGTECGTTFPATKARGLSHYGHVKHMYCFKCKVTRMCIQIDADGHVPTGGDPQVAHIVGC